MAILADCHMHSSFSGDSETPMEEMADRACYIGLKDICFTEHMDLDYPEGTGDDEKLPPDCFEVDMSKYSDKISHVQTEYSGRLNIGYGLEFGLCRGLEDRYAKIASSYDLDFIIGSTHLCHNKDIPWSSFWALGDETELFQDYFEESLANITSYTDFDTYGHLDYVVRYAPFKEKNYSYSRYSDIIDEILKRLISLGKGLELNTKGKRCGLSEMNPCTDILRRYKDLGGDIVTIGSDAHVPSDVGALLDNAGEILSSCGFRYYAVYHKRKPEMYRI